MVDQQSGQENGDRAAALAAGIEAALPGWVERSVRSRLGRTDPAVLAAVTEAGRRAATEVGGRVRALLASDIDDQPTTPMSLLREAVRYPTGVLRDAGVPPVPRDDFSREHFPDDDYDLSPASFGDVDPALGELGIAWGAAKAWAHKQRHRTSPRRVAAYVPDLMDRSKVAAAAADVVFVRRPEDLTTSDAELIVVDLARPGVLDVLPALSARIVGFGSHVDRELLDAARQAGCDEVLARSAFFSRLPDLLR